MYLITCFFLSLNFLDRDSCILRATVSNILVFKSERQNIIVSTVH